MKHESWSIVRLVIVALTLVSAVGGTQAAQTADARRDAVARALSGDRQLRDLTVSVDEQGRVLLSGDLPTLWLKMRAIDLALDAAGGAEVVSELTLPRAESDETLAQDVADAIGGYEHYTVFDYLTGRVNDGVVTLQGEVTAPPDKPRQLTELVAKIRGVQEIRNAIEILPPSRSDDVLRLNLARQIFSHPSFERFSGMINPPFHILVHNGIVTLIGYVQSQIEMIEIQQIVSQTQGILRVENKLQTVK